MELCFLKSNALDTLKKSLPQIFEKYFVERNNSWLAEICGENPFVKFRTVPNFELAPLDLEVGEIDLLNSKIIYKNLNFLTPRQAADERFWAGLCHGVFYDYVRRRWGYDKPNDFTDGKIIDRIKNRFFFNGGRQALSTNTLSKYWWAGYIFSSEGLDILGAKDFYTKIFSIMTRSFIGNAKLLSGFMKFLRHFKDRDITLSADNHIRPAMSELNKRGGAIILDCLTEEEIAAIMIEHVEKILAPKVVVFKPPVKPVVAPPKNIRTVKTNNIVKVLFMEKGTQHSYRIGDILKKNFPDIYGELFGKEINSLVTIRGNTCKITEIK